MEVGKSLSQAVRKTARFLFLGELMGQKALELVTRRIAEKKKRPVQSGPSPEAVAKVRLRLDVVVCDQTWS